MQTSGRPGCHYEHMTNSLLLRTAGNEILKIKFDPKARSIHRVDVEHVKGKCRCCSEQLPDDHTVSGYRLPPGYVANALMSKHFNFANPICFECANGKPPVILDTCSSPDGIIAGRRVEKVLTRSSFVASRQEATKKFNEKVNERNERSLELFKKRLTAAAINNAPDMRAGDEIDDGAVGSDAADSEPPSDDESAQETEAPDLSNALSRLDQF